MLTTTLDIDALAARESLHIRPLTEFPRLRAAMGLDDVQRPELPKRTPVNAKRSQRPTAKQSHPKPAAVRPGESKRLTGTQARRFDRRALLESSAA